MIARSSAGLTALAAIAPLPLLSLLAPCICMATPDITPQARSCGSMFTSAPYIQILPPGCFDLETGDLNGDAVPDLVTVATDEGELTVCLGKGDGTFDVSQQGLGGAILASSVALGDLDGDGKQDAVAALTYPTSTLRVLVGDGSGRLTVAGDPPPVGYHPTSVTLADINRDGRLDVLVFSREYDDSLQILRGRGDGTFDPPVRYPGVGELLAKPLVSDLDGDGWPDIVVLSPTGRQVSVLMGEQGGSFQLRPPVDPPDVEVISSILEADWNGDGRLDLAVVGFTDSYPIASAIAVLIGTGTGSFSQGPVYLSTDVLSGGAVADFDRDGRADLAVFESSLRGVQLLLGSGDGSFTASEEIGLNYSPTDVVAVDLNQDGLPDIASLGTSNRLIAIDLNVGPPITADVRLAPRVLVDRSTGGSITARVTLPPAAASIGLDVASIRLGGVAPSNVSPSSEARDTASGPRETYQLKFPREGYLALGPGEHMLDLRACLVSGRGVRGEAVLTVALPPRGKAGHASAQIRSLPGRVPVEIAWGGGGAGELTCEVFDVQGRRIATTASRQGTSGLVSWDGRYTGGTPAPAGIYFLRISAAGRAVVLKTVIVH